MNLTKQVYDLAIYMLPELLAENAKIMETVSRAAVVSLETKLRDNLSVEDCLEDFVMAAAMYTAAAMSEIGDMGQLEQITAGDLTLRKANGSMAAERLRSQADMLMAPYVKTTIAFMGV